MTKDPICGMMVDEATALRAERGGETFYFCSEHCRKKFLSAPAGAKPAEESRATARRPQQEMNLRTRRLQQQRNKQS